MFAMTLRARLGRIEPKRWKNVIAEDVVTGLECNPSESRYIAERACESNICLDASEEVLAYLETAGFDVEEVVLDRSRKPLDILRRRIRDEIMHGVKVTPDEVTALVRDHVKFTDLILTKEFEYAYEIWSESYR